MVISRVAGAKVAMKMKSLSLVCFVVLSGFSSMSQAGDVRVRLQRQEHKISVWIGAEHFADYRTGPDLRKPYLLPVRSEGDTIITRPLWQPGDKEQDHLHHKGVWVAVDEVNGLRFWNERSKIKTSRMEILEDQRNPARIRVVNHWLDDSSEPVLEETTEIRFYANRLMAYDIRFTPAVEAVTFNDTKEGLFGIRLANTMREKEGGAFSNVVSENGCNGSADCWGKRSDWVDYHGPVGGGIHGAAIFDHPENFRPSRYHVRDYGLFSINPFGEKAYTRGESAAQPVILKPGQTLRLRYGLYIHPGGTVSANVAEVYSFWLENS